MNELECSICLCEINNGKKTYILPCKHMFHLDCIESGLCYSMTCPNCRGKITDYEILFKKIQELHGILGINIDLKSLTVYFIEDLYILAFDLVKYLSNPKTKNIIKMMFAYRRMIERKRKSKKRRLL